MVKSKISSKGQITLPKRVREALGVGPGDEVAFEVREGEVVLRLRKRVSLRDLLGRFRGRVAYPGEEGERKAREEAWAQEP
ncbi:AbrB/MazE/SpoVT family DNA-binding domain-containing protein [Thermus amyloliquefaciens]|uniref:AbrB/MazE/SpoVT family DNA-binding domain-containing protein n=1 Tax=Thermus amyloliquefaciens TaxID=1449080 RepID=UPI000571C528|nr:AbrB/MazE/SpoVT family DNA-binding domain-containing protein [Thermus amyloliquefaciens]